MCCGVFFFCAQHTHMTHFWYMNFYCYSFRAQLTCLSTSFDKFAERNISVAFKIGTLPVFSTSQHRNKSPKYRDSVSVIVTSSMFFGMVSGFGDTFAHGRRRKHTQFLFLFELGICCTQMRSTRTNLLCCRTAGDL